jgi:hypothetical protein
LFNFTSKFIRNVGPNKKLEKKVDQEVDMTTPSNLEEVLVKKVRQIKIKVNPILKFKKKNSPPKIFIVV